MCYVWGKVAVVLCGGFVSRPMNKCVGCKFSLYHRVIPKLECVDAERDSILQFVKDFEFYDSSSSSQATAQRRSAGG